MSNNKYRILLVEDDENIKGLISTMLETSGYQAATAGTVRSALLMIASHTPDLIILDLGLPDGDGLILLEDLRKRSAVPVIVLSARSDEHDKVTALDMGANDYVTKPFGSAELLARVRSALRNGRPGPEEGKLPGGRFTLRDLMIEYDSRRVFIGKNEIKLTQTEYNIVFFLSVNRGKVMTYHAIIKAVWGGYPQEGSIKKLQVNMANIRKKFGARPGAPSYITNELGVGYRMNDE